MKIKNDISAETLQAEVARRMQLQDQRAARITQQRKRADALEMGRMTGHLEKHNRGRTRRPYVPAILPCTALHQGAAPC